MATNEIAGGTVQTLDGGNAEVSLQLSQGTTELMVTTDVGQKEEKYSIVYLTRDELWEHVHNCLNALTLLPK